MKITDQEDLLSVQIQFDSQEEKDKTIALLMTIDKKIIGFQRGKQYMINKDDIYYIELIDKKNFIYTKDECYESALWLY